MKIKRTDVVVESSFSRSRAFNQSCRQIRKAIRSITWGNEGDGRFIINPTRDGNGVVPLTDQIGEAMQEASWSRQQFRDREARVGAIDFVSPDGLVGFEFDTGNMSSAYRSPVKLLSLLRGKENQRSRHRHTHPEAGTVSDRPHRPRGGTGSSLRGVQGSRAAQLRLCCHGVRAGW